MLDFETLPEMKMASNGAPVNGLSYKIIDVRTFHSGLAKSAMASYSEGTTSVRAKQTTHMVQRAMHNLAQSTSLTSKTLTNGIAIPAISLQKRNRDLLSFPIWYVSYL